jgi:hypothetical protein
MATATGTTSTRHVETTRLPRTTGALSGLLVIVLGLWGALIPFFGPYFHYAFGSFQTWHYTNERLWLDIVPGVVAVIGGFMLLRSTHRTTGLIGGWLALAAGAWFVAGPTVSLLWHHAGDPIGAPLGAYTRRMLELLGYFQALGLVIAALAAFAMGRYYSRPRLVEEAAVAAGEPVAAEAAGGRTAPRHQPVGAGEEPREEPVAAAAAAGPVAAHEERRAARNEPVAGAAAGEGAVAGQPRERTVAGEPSEGTVAGEPAITREEPGATDVPRRDESLANEPVASTSAGGAPADEPAAGTAAEPAAPADEPAPSAPTGAYRRRPGLSRFRRR